jgi:spermidine synthase
MNRKPQGARLPITNCRLPIANDRPLPPISPGTWVTILALAAFVFPIRAAVIYDTVSPYHHIQVVDQDGLRTLSFDGSRETRMSIRDPLAGHFQYTEFFHLARLWNTNLNRALMIGLGGGSTQRSFLHYDPGVRIDTVEIDPVVLQVATNFFGVKLGERHRVHVMDGRVFLRRTRERFGLVVVDAYVKHRYGSQIPPHLVTREFMELAREHLTAEGVMAYNVIGTLRGPGADLLAALIRTLQEVYPQVYLFPATESQNVVLLATRTPRRLAAAELQQRANQLMRQRRVTPPGFMARLQALQSQHPPTVATAPILTDDRAPVESLAR